MAEQTRSQFLFRMTKSGKFEAYMSIMNTAKSIALRYGLAEG
jgi:hypothetical protein